MRRRLTELCLFALLCGIVAFWTMHLRAPVPEVIASAAPTAAPPGFDAEVQTRLFGGAVATAAHAQLRATGVVAPTRAGSPGVALIALDDKPARAYGIGQAIAPGWILREVHTDRIVIDRNGARLEIAVPQARPGAGSTPSGNSAPTVATAGGTPTLASPAPGVGASR